MVVTRVQRKMLTDPADAPGPSAKPEIPTPAAKKSDKQPKVASKRKLKMGTDTDTEEIMTKVTNDKTDDFKKLPETAILTPDTSTTKQPKKRGPKAKVDRDQEEEIPANDDVKTKPAKGKKKKKPAAETKMDIEEEGEAGEELAPPEVEDIVMDKTDKKKKKKPIAAAPIEPRMDMETEEPEADVTFEDDNTPIEGDEEALNEDEAFIEDKDELAMEDGELSDDIVMTEKDKKKKKKKPTTSAETKISRLEIMSTKKLDEKISPAKDTFLNFKEGRISAKKGGDGKVRKIASGNIVSDWKKKIR